MIAFIVNYGVNALQNAVWIDAVVYKFDKAQIDLIKELDLYSYMYSLVQNKKFNAYDFEKLIDFIEANEAKLLDEEG